MVADNLAGIQAVSHFPPTWTVQAVHGIAVYWPTIERILINETHNRERDGSGGFVGDRCDDDFL
jgi:hypothetical protein